jgi:hypothetical protein
MRYRNRIERIERVVEVKDTPQARSAAKYGHQIVRLVRPGKPRPGDAEIGIFPEAPGPDFCGLVIELDDGGPAPARADN